MIQAHHRRRSLRLKGYDYSQAGAYFVTICTRGRTCVFGDIALSIMQLNENGVIAQKAWNALPEHYHHVSLDAFVVMPNHVHGIIILTDDPKLHALSEIVRAFKTFSARAINHHNGTRGAFMWQRNYYEHIVRNENELSRIRRYIVDNPACWAKDGNNPAVWSLRES